MGRRGPAPKRSDQRRRRNKPAIAITRVEGAAVEPPELGFAVHPLAAAWYDALKGGPEARYYTPATWQRARLAAEELSRYLYAEKRSPTMHAAIQADMKALLVDAGELRRLGIRLPPPTTRERGTDE